MYRIVQNRCEYRNILKMKIRHPNSRHTYPKPESVRYSLAYSHNSYSILILSYILFSYSTYV